MSGVLSNANLIRAKLANGAPIDANDRIDLVAVIDELARFPVRMTQRKGPSVAGLSEADIVINGTPLSFGEAMAVRVAVSSFLMSLSEARKTLGPIADGYHDRLREVEGLIFKAFR